MVFLKQRHRDTRESALSIHNSAARSAAEPEGLSSTVKVGWAVCQQQMSVCLSPGGVPFSHLSNCNHPTIKKHTCPHPRLSHWDCFVTQHYTE